MVKKPFNKLLQYGACIVVLSGSYLSAADRKQTVVPGNRPKQDTSYTRYNDLAKKYYNEKNPTDETIEAFKAALKKDEKFYERRKQCKIELDLLLQDVEAKKNARALTAEKPTETLQEFINKPENQEAAAKIRALKLFKERKEQAAQQAATAKPKDAIIQKPTIDLSLPPITSITHEERVTTRPRPTQEPQITEPIVMPTPEPEEPTLTPEEKRGVIIEEPAEETVPARPLEQEVADLKKAGVTQITPQDLQIVSSVEPTLFTDIIQPLMTLAVQEPQRIKARKVIETTIQVLPTFTPQVQTEVTNRMAAILKLAQQAEGIRTVTLQMQELTQKLLEQKIVTKNLQKNLAAANVKDFRVGTEADGSEYIDPASMRSIIFKTLWNGNLTQESTKAIADTLTNATALITRETDKYAPVIGTALVVAPIQQSVQDIKKSFAMKLDQFDLIANLEQEKAQKLIKEAEDSRLTKWWARWLNRKPEDILSELIALYIFLQSVGRETVYSIEQAEKHTLFLMDAQTQEQWQQGTFDMVPYIENRGDLPDLHKKRDYSTELENLIQTIEKKVASELLYIQDAGIRKKMEDELTQAKVLYTDSYARAQQEATEQREQNFKALPASEIKVAQPAKPTKPTGTPKPTPPTKPKPAVAPTTVTTTSTTQLPAPTRPTVQPIPTEQPPVEVATEEEFEPFAQEVMPEEIEEEEEFKLPAPTAHPVVSPELDRIRSIVRTLDVLTSSTGHVGTLKNQLQAIQETADKREYAMLEDQLNLIYRQIERAQFIRRSINDITEATQLDKPLPESSLKNVKQYVLNTPNDPYIKPFPKDAYRTLKTEFEKAATSYVLMLIQPLNELATLHQNIRDDMTQIGKLPDNLLERIQAIVALQEFLTVDAKKSLKDIFNGLCAIYDATLFALFTPELFAKALAALKEAEQSEDTLTAYKRLVEEVRDILDTIKYTQLLSTFIQLFDKEIIGAFDREKYDLMEAHNPTLQKEDGTYVYALPAETNVQLDANTTIPTLTAITPKHKKEYMTILQQWLERIDNNEKIQKLLSFNPATIAPENLAAELAEFKEDIESLRDYLPREFIEALEKVSTESEAFKAAQESVTIINDIAKLKARIEEAHRKLKNSGVIEQVIFGTPYTQIQTAIAAHPLEAQRASLTQELTNVVKLFGEYLTDSAQSFNGELPTLPTNAFALKPETNKTITALTTKIAKSEEFTTMLKKLKELGLLNNTEFDNLYKTLLTGYGYVLTAFDALNAKLVDNAEVKQGFFSAFTSNTSTVYKTAQELLKLMGLVAKLRNDYYLQLVAPYFDQKIELVAYNAGTLNIASAELGLKNIGTPDAYTYKRTQIKGYTGTPPITFPTGIHKPLKAERPYRTIVEEWKEFIEGSLKGTATQERQNRVQKALTAILNTPVYGVPFKDMHMFSTKNNFFDVLTDVLDTAYKIRYEIGQEVNVPVDRLIPYAYRGALPAEKLLPQITKMLADAPLLKDLEQLKKDGTLTNAIQTDVAQLVGSSFALVDGLIHWIYTQTKDSDDKDNDDKVYNNFVGIMALTLQEPINQLVYEAEKYLPYVNTAAFTSLALYASKAQAERAGAIPGLADYRYAIFTPSTGLLSTTYAPVPYQGSKLYQAGDTTTKQKLTAQLKILDILIGKLNTPIARFATQIDAVQTQITKLAREKQEDRMKDLTTALTNGFASLARELPKIPRAQQKNALEVLNKIALALINAYQGAQ